MHFISKTVWIATFALISTITFAQTDNSEAASDSEQLKIAALEALISAPEERALPLVEKVLSGNHSDEVKSRALFVLSQIDMPEAQAVLLEAAKSGDGEFRLEAIRMIGIGGDTGALNGLADIYASGNEEVQESVLEAYLIADETDAVFQLAANAKSDEEFEAAVHVLGAMGATAELRKLRDYTGNSESLIHAYAVAGDSESLRVLALDNSSPERQMQAIHGLGIVGGEEADATLVEVYRSSKSGEVRDAAMHGMMVADNDKGLLELFRSSQDANEKRDLLRMLVMMDSEAALDVIDAALSNDQ